MKKISIFLSLIALITVAFASCNGTARKQNVALKTGIDSLSYAIGVQQADQMKDVLIMRRGLDPEHMDEFINGFLDAMYPKGGKTSKNYDLGQQVGSELRTAIETESLMPGDSVFMHKDAYVDGVIEALNDKGIKIPKDDARNFMQQFFEKAERQANASAIDTETAFLTENKTKEGVIETESGLQYKIITEGTGEIPGENMTVKVHYVGTLLDGTEFDSSVKRDEPFEFNTSGGVIPAWLEASKMMPIGSKWVIYAPSELAYGSRDMGVIPPYSTLIFEIEMLEIVKDK